jgi:hypothetical protein
MNTLTITLLTAITLSGFPIGLLIAKLTPEELKSGKLWFKIIIIFCILAIITSFFLFQDKILIFLCTSFIFIILLILPSVIKLRRKEKKR